MATRSQKRRQQKTRFVDIHTLDTPGAPIVQEVQPVTTSSPISVDDVVDAEPSRTYSPFSVIQSTPLVIAVIVLSLSLITSAILRYRDYLLTQSRHISKISPPFDLIFWEWATGQRSGGDSGGAEPTSASDWEEKPALDMENWNIEGRVALWRELCDELWE